MLVLSEVEAVDAECVDVEAHGACHGQVLALELAVALDEVGCQDVAHADAVAGNLVGVGGADALEGGAYLGAALGLLVGGVHHAVGGQDEVGFLADKQVLCGIDTFLGEGVNLLAEDAGLDEDPVAYEVGFLLVEDAAGDDVQHMLGAVELEGMASVGAALETGYYVVFGGQDVDNLTLAFVAPL